MAYVKAPIPSEVYHLTQMDKLDDILDDGKIRRFGDTECWFCESLAKMKAYMEQTVLCEGKPYYGAGGQLCHYPKFDPDKYVILKLTPCRREGNWYRWNQEIPLNSPPELVQAAAEFSKLKIGFRGDLPFRNAEAIDVAEFLHGSIVCRKVQTASELWARLSEKIERNWQTYQRSLYDRSPGVLIGMADEISAAATCYSEFQLSGAYLPKDMRNTCCNSKTRWRLPVTAGYSSRVQTMAMNFSTRWNRCGRKIMPSRIIRWMKRMRKTRKMK